MCFPPNVLCATAVVSAAMNLKIDLGLTHLRPEVREAHFPGMTDPVEKGKLRFFPWRELFDCDFEEVSRVSEFLLRFIRLIKYPGQD